MTEKSNEPLWWKRGVVYQIYPRSFKDSNGDGIGDLAGIIEKLDYVRELGVDAIWLSPIYPSPMADFGYDVSNYTDIDPMFGDLATFDKLVAEAHQRDLKIIIDYVPNHSSDQHPWFIESRSSRDNPKRNWYIWADGKPGGKPPNNWLSVFGGSSWEWDEKTGQYYLHSFLKEQPDLNWRNPETRAAMLHALRFWLERGVDGFRIDVAHFIMKHPDMPDLPPNPNAANPDWHSMGAYDSLLHVYDLAHEDVHGVFREIRALMDSFSATQPRYVVGEIHVFDWSKWATYYGANLDELHMPFNFALITAKWLPSVVRKVVDSVDAAVPEGAWPNYVLGNHDEHRVASRVGAAQARVAMMLVLTLRGTPTMYYGDEIGMHDVEIPPEREQDPFGKRVPGLNLGRDPERTPMQWDSSANAGFDAPGSTPWLPVADDYKQINVAAQRDNAHSMLGFTKQLLTVRRQTLALNSGRYSPVDGVPADCLAFMRQFSGERRLILLNFSSKEIEISLPQLMTKDAPSVVLSTYLDREGAADLKAFRLRPDEGCIINIGD